MNIIYHRGDDHEVRCRFKNFEGEFDDIIFIVKNLNERSVIEKHLGEDIIPKDGWYHVILKPKDTENLSYTERMIYELRVIIQGLEFTVKKGNFVLK